MIHLASFSFFSQSQGRSRVNNVWNHLINNKTPSDNQTKTSVKDNSTSNVNIWHVSVKKTKTAKLIIKNKIKN